MPRPRHMPSSSPSHTPCPRLPPGACLLPECLLNKWMDKLINDGCMTFIWGQGRLTGDAQETSAE